MAASSDAATDAGVAVEDGLQRTKSAVTTMLAASPHTKRCHDVLASVPRRPGEETESRPIATLRVPRGKDFCIDVAFIVIKVIILSYIFSILIGVVFTLANYAARSCGQETWMTDAETACDAKLINAFALGIELRCLAEKPDAMLQKDFDETCGAGAMMDLLGTIAFLCAMAGYYIYTEFGKMPSQIHFHAKLFTVQSNNGKCFTCSYYSDVTSATTSMRGLEIVSKAKVSLMAGGQDEDQGWFSDEKKGKVINVVGESTILTRTGHGEERLQFLQEFAKYLPVSIEGFSGVSALPAMDAESMLDGRLGEVLKARKGNLGDEPTVTESVRKPLTCDFVTEVIFWVVVIAFIWYAQATVTKFVSWAVKYSRNKCKDPMKPDEDMCAIWRIFVPLDLPIVNPSDYLNVALLLVTAVVFVTYQLTYMKMEYRFHRNGAMQEVLFAGWEFQENAMIFEDDVESIELKEGSLEKIVRVKAIASYSITEGISKPFAIRARFVEGNLDVVLVDASCAACSGHSDRAQSHRESVLRSLEKFKPGMLPAPQQ